MTTDGGGSIKSLLRMTTPKRCSYGKRSLLRLGEGYELGRAKEQRRGRTALAGESQPVGYTRLKRLRKRCRHTAGGASGTTETTARRPPAIVLSGQGGLPLPRIRCRLTNLLARELWSSRLTTFTRLNQAETRDTALPGLAQCPTPTARAALAPLGPRLPASSAEAHVSLAQSPIRCRP